MDARQFFDLVTEMRKYQRMYFNSNGRDKAALHASRDLERQVDTEIERVRIVIKEQQMPRLGLWE